MSLARAARRVVSGSVWPAQGPGIPIGRECGLKHRPVWVRVPPGAPPWLSVLPSILAVMYDEKVRRRALALLRGGLTLSQASHTLGVSRAALRDWQSGAPRAARDRGCPRCGGAEPHRSGYAALL